MPSGEVEIRVTIESDGGCTGAVSALAVADDEVEATGDCVGKGFQYPDTNLATGDDASP